MCCKGCAVSKRIASVCELAGDEEVCSSCPWYPLPARTSNGQESALALSRQKAAEVLRQLLPGCPQQHSCSTAPPHLLLHCPGQDGSCKHRAVSVPCHDLDRCRLFQAQPLVKAEKPVADLFKTMLEPSLFPVCALVLVSGQQEPAPLLAGASLAP